MYGQERNFVGRLLPKSEWGTGKPAKSIESNSEANNESDSAAEPKESTEAEKQAASKIALNMGKV